MSHTRIVMLDISLRNQWHPQSKLKDGLKVHSWWRKLLDFQLTGD